MDNRKIVIAFYLFVSMVFWGLSRAFLHFVHTKSYWVRGLAYNQFLLETLPIILAVVLFAVLSRYKKANDFFDECVSELRKVTWPSREDVVRSTIVVLVWIVVSSLILGGLDGVIGKVVTYLLQVKI